jgi:hypothetical protein
LDRMGQPVTEGGASPGALFLLLVALMKGVMYKETDPGLWLDLVNLQARIRDHVAVIGLELVVDEVEGFAYLRQRPPAEDGPQVPRLVRRRPLGYPVSLLLALLRKKLAEFDATSGETRLILGREDMIDLIRLFLPETANEAKLSDRLDTTINRIVELGFLRRLQGGGDRFEVRRILKTFVDAQWLNEFDRRLASYREYLAGGEAGRDEAG